MTQVKEILLGIPLVIFVFWVFAAPLPSERIVRVCEPIHWAGNLVTSTTALASDKHTSTSVRWSDKMNYSCQYMVWRLLYQDDYNKAVAAGLVKSTDVAKDPVAVNTEAQKAEAEKPPVAPQAPATPSAGAPKK